ncbi:MAG TPA: PhoX family phosphatase [Usitatibacteraceae bacterium]|jgi:secreted PhoX family phosphatase|nr:PhoX family phosphatase [Usitatibacteraceae bacterium]
MAYSIRDDDGTSNASGNPHLTQLVDAAIARNPSRRAFLKTGLGAAVLPFLGGVAACGGSGGDDIEKILGFIGVATSSGDAMVVPAGYRAETLTRWGDALLAGAPDFRGDASETSAEAELQVGDNHDALHFFGFRNADGTEKSDSGLLVINHEYINPEYYYAPGTDPANWLLPFTAEKARKGLAGHGISVIEVRRKADGGWEVVRPSTYNRRITGYTPMEITGPARGHEMLRTAADPGGTSVLGTLNNCAAGWTPWGTYITCEENFNGYFGWNGTRTPSAAENRYGIAKDGFGYLWHTVDPRFDVNANPNEPNRFGWVVEIDPFTPGSTPKKRTALGRFKHENAEVVVAPGGKIVVYMGDDERNDYIYKFVTTGTYSPGAAGNANLLDSGTLYVGKFEAGAATGDRMGTGTWVPLVFGQGGLDEANGFTSQADVLIRARQAADRVGATMMDRPEWIAANPKKRGEVYIALTNNNRRGTTPASSNRTDGTSTAGSARPAVDDANPRADNQWGHVLRWNETGGDPTATSFSWDIFLVAGNPKAVTDRANLRSGTSNITVDNMFNSPDGLQFDASGRLWIQTDGSFTNTGNFDGQGNNQMLAADVVTGEVRRFLVGPSGCEITGVTWTPDRKTMFVNVQHPGELGSHPNRPRKADGTAYGDNDIARDAARFSTFPNAGDATVKGTSPRPRSATIVVRKADGGVVGA